MQCNEFQNLIESYFIGDPSVKEDFEAHLAGCARCRNELALYHAIENAISSELLIEPPASLVSKIMARIPIATPASVPKRYFSALITAVGLAIGIMLGMFIFFGRETIQISDKVVTGTETTVDKVLNYSYNLPWVNIRDGLSKLSNNHDIESLFPTILVLLFCLFLYYITSTIYDIFREETSFDRLIAEVSEKL